MQNVSMKGAKRMLTVDFWKDLQLILTIFKLDLLLIVLLFFFLPGSPLLQGQTKKYKQTLPP